MAALAQELGLTLVPMDDCTLLGNDGQPVPEAMDQRIQRLWNRVLDECAERQKKNNNSSTLPPSGMGSAGDDSRGETSEESHGEGSSGAESETLEHEGTNKDHAHVPDEDGTRKAAPIDAAQESKGPVGSGRAGGSVDRVMLQRPAHGTESTAPASLGKVLEETARVHLASFSKSEMEVWDWHRGNLEISCGAVSNSSLGIGGGAPNIADGRVWSPSLNGAFSNDS